MLNILAMCISEECFVNLFSYHNRLPKLVGVL